MTDRIEGQVTSGNLRGTVRSAGGLTGTVRSTSSLRGSIGQGGGRANVPYATEEIAGIAKLYDRSGDNVDGGMTQRSVTHTIEDSSRSITAEELFDILI